MLSVFFLLVCSENLLNYETYLQNSEIQKWLKLACQSSTFEMAINEQKPGFFDYERGVAFEKITIQNFDIVKFNHNKSFSIIIDSCYKLFQQEKETKLLEKESPDSYAYLIDIEREIVFRVGTLGSISEWHDVVWVSDFIFALLGVEENKPFIHFFDLKKGIDIIAWFSKLEHGSSNRYDQFIIDALDSNAKDQDRHLLPFTFAIQEKNSRR